MKKRLNVRLLIPMIILWVNFTHDVKSETISLMSDGHVWSYHALSQDLGSDWLLDNYDYSGWPSGPSPLGFASSSTTKKNISTTIPQATPNQPTVYFKTTVNIPEDIHFDNVNIIVNHIVDDAVVLYVNGHKVFTHNQDENAEKFQNYCVTVVGTPYWLYDRIIPKNHFKKGINHISAMLKNSDSTSSDLIVGFTMRIESKINQAPDANEVLTQANALKEADYTTPSWTQMLAAKKKSILDATIPNIESLKTAIEQLQPKEMPYCVNMTLNGDPTSQIGFTWYTNAGISPGKVQIVSKGNADENDFLSPELEINATAQPLNNLNYITVSNLVDIETDIPPHSKRSYVSNKALTTGLSPNTTYSFRVGNEGVWSKTGTFVTADNSKEPFKFLYITDTQALIESHFDISRQTLTAANKKVDDARFILMTGDFVETAGPNNSEWEWERWFESVIQSAAYTIPFVPTPGNHDQSVNQNFTHHFNTDNSFVNYYDKHQLKGINYSFVYGDALFLVFSFEDYARAGYMDALKLWLKNEVEKHPNVTWRIAAFHKNMFTGGKHITEVGSKIARSEFLHLFDELKIDMAFQGHDHVYEVIGPIDNKTKTVISNNIISVRTVPVNGKVNLNGKEGGVFDVNGGTLYFLNGAAGNKMYSASSKSKMESTISEHEVNNYWNLFTGKFGEPGFPTFSEVSVDSDQIGIDTYIVKNGLPSLYDSFKIIKSAATSALIKQELGSINCFPGITTSAFTVSANMPIKQIDVHNLLGQKLQSGFINGVEGTIDISHFVSGNYYINVILDNGFTSSHKVIKI